MNRKAMISLSPLLLCTVLCTALTQVTPSSPDTTNYYFLSREPSSSILNIIHQEHTDNIIIINDWLNDLAISYCVMLIYALIMLAMSLQNHLSTGEQFLNDEEVSSSIETQHTSSQITTEESEGNDHGDKEVDDLNMSMIEMVPEIVEEGGSQDFPSIETQNPLTISTLYSHSKITEGNDDKEGEDSDTLEESSFDLSYIETPRRESKDLHHDYSPSDASTITPRSQSDLDRSDLSIVSSPNDEESTLLDCSLNHDDFEINEQFTEPPPSETTSFEELMARNLERITSLNSEVMNEFAKEASIILAQLQDIKGYNNVEEVEKEEFLFSLAMEIYETRLIRMDVEAQRINLKIQNLTI
ncbi:predicted protein [Naegleria gruberi]|uniref:Predicted protein n=1 Tax=Naegleria gruberi TaxID=5762 RepID=D2VYW2_NAEGR|nr:uncharacterized protein NAEGRDRAFT_74265 [Naegleria gruberi]EFC37981.1 predicted protein [Naegleria gruberi]|eukprot:XP_002670725.1 predicted protein [Naegleria gruberi strain NEG-M]